MKMRSASLRGSRRQLQLSLESPAERFDPLGEDYCESATPQERRNSGITLTPEWLVRWMLERSEAFTDAGSGFGRVVDPGCGTARFALLAAQRWPQADVIGIEAQSELAALARRAVRRTARQGRIDVRGGDFREFALPEFSGRTLFVGNPPYVRHHDLAPQWKAWYANGMSQPDIEASALAGLHAHFLLKTAQCARAGDAFCFVLPAEWLDTRYGSALRQLLSTRLRVSELWLADKSDPVFDDAMVTTIVVAGQVGAADNPVRLGRLDRDGGRELRVLTADTLAATERWSTFWHEDRDDGCVRSGGIQIGDVFSVRRGQVTGNNALWTFGADFDGALPPAVLRPTVTRARELFDLDEPRLVSDAALKRVIDIPADWKARFDGADTRRVRSFIDWAARRGGGDSYIARHRAPWFCVRLGEPAPILMTYMARRAPRFVLNDARAAILNIAHGLYPHTSLTRAQLASAVKALNLASNIRDGRSYSGNLIKFEPRDAMRMRFDWTIGLPA